LQSLETHRGNREAIREGSYGRFLYNYFRTYDPATGRYLEADPIGQAGGINLYVYAGDNPTGNIDPSGLFDLANSPVGRFVADLPIDGAYAKCLADCIDELNLGAPGLIPPLFSRLPKEALPPFRYVPTGAPGAGGTTLVSSGAGVLARRGLISTSTRRAARNFGRMASRVATPLTLAEGAWSYGIIGYCMNKCEPECEEEPVP
jgi:RHS repeat-associated protein